METIPTASRAQATPLKSFNSRLKDPARSGRLARVYHWRMDQGSTFVSLSAALANRELSSLELASEYLRRIKDKASEGGRVFIRLNAELAQDASRADAERVEAQRRGAEPASPFLGVPVSVKDLFDIAGQVTTAGSRVFASAPAATRDSPVVKRLKSAGMVLVGATNMTEFAYSGLGLNPHFGTPKNPFDRERGRIPGGSSSGAAISVTDGMAAVAIGTDTSGSCRIPAALCGLVGFKPTARRVPTAGVVPLSSSLDSIGPIGRSVSCCALVDAVLAAEQGDWLPEVQPLSGLRIGRLVNYVEEQVEPSIASAYDHALTRLEAAGAHLSDLRLAALDRLPELLEDGGLAAAEAYAWHKRLLENSRDQYDPRVASRILMGARQGAATYRSKLRLRRRIIERANFATSGFDLLCFPSVALTAPTIESLRVDEAYVRTNLLMLRNPGVANMLDRPAISLPIPAAGFLPVGLTLMGETMSDRRFLGIALAAESALNA